MHKTFAYRLYPTRAQEARLAETLEECRWLYNKLLEERKFSWEVQQESIGLNEQHARLPALKQARESLRSVYSQVLQNVALRLDRAFRSFFRRCRAGESPGYPRFKGQGRYDSFTFPQAPLGCQLRRDKLHLSKIGPVKIVLHRPVEGTIKTCAIKRAPTGKWFAYLSCEVEPKRLEPSGACVGVDVGLASFAALSTGETLANPCFFRKEERALARVQRRLDISKQGTAWRKKLHRGVVRIHERVANRRHDFIHQAARKLVVRFGLIATEDLEVDRLARARRFSKSIRDAAWSMFFTCLSYKAEEAGRTFVRVNPAYTSQDCSSCGARQLMPLAKRVYCCPSCGSELDRDVNAARNILAVGLHGLGLP